MMSLECMSTAMKLGYIQNIKHRKDPIYRTNIQDNNFELCAENMVNYNAKNRRVVYLKRTKK